MSGSMIGRVFNNRYELTERIGIGGMAEVYQAQDQVLGRRVAVKVMLPQYAADTEFTQRFRQEAAAAANLQSPFIVNVYDWGQDAGVYYIVMEFVRGSDLKTAIKQRGAINQRKVAEIGAQVCQALTVAHNQDIVHRDIKPQNIMVQPDGNVKVMDFGIARAKNSLSSKTSAVLGTAHYISPEQAQGKDLTAASDIYSLGIVMYEAATGVLPFDGPDSVSVAMKQVNEDPVPPSQINPEIDYALENIIMQALEKDPRARFETASDMKHALNDYLAGRTATVAYDQTQMMPTAYSPETFVQPEYEPVDTTVIPAVSSEAAANMHQQRTMLAEEENRRSGRRWKAALAILLLLALAGLAAFGANMWMNRSGTVPNVQGQTVDQAVQTIQNAGFQLGAQSEEYSDTIDSGKVIETDPAAGSEVAPGTQINMVISKGKEQIAVPDVRAHAEADAKKLLEEAGLKGSAGTSAYSDTVPEGNVISQNPEAGTMVNKGAEVTYVISKGKELVKIPNVVGQPEDGARAALESAGLVPQSIYDFSTTVAAGNVMYQDPDPDAEVAKGSSVTICISQGSNMHTISAVVVDQSGSPSDYGSVTLSEEQVADGEADSYWISVSDGYEIVSVMDSRGDNYGTDANGAITDVTTDIQLIVTIAKVEEEHKPATSSSSSSSSETTTTSEVTEENA